MFLRVIAGSLGRRWRRKGAALASIALATGAATALFGIFLGVGDAVREEFHSNRHNILIEPSREGGWIREADLDRISSLKWRNQIVAWAPLLPVETDVDGRRVTVVGTRWDALHRISPAWKLEGTAGGVIAGRSSGFRAGDRVLSLTVTGILSTGEEWDERLLVDLGVAQRIADRPGWVRSVLVRAVTTPDSDVVRKFQLDPKSLTTQEMEKFNCTPFAATIAKELTDVIPDAEARPLRRATESESRLLGRIDAVLLVLAVAALVAGGVGVMTSMTATVIDRRQEIGLLKALGATDGAVVALFLGEAVLLAALGGVVGWAMGWAASGALGSALLGRAMTAPPVVGVLAMGSAVLVAAGGMLAPLRAVLSVDPTRALHET